MAKKDKKSPAQAPAKPVGPSVVFRASPAFTRRFEQLTLNDPALIDAFERFKAAKVANPLEPVSGQDRMMFPNAPIGQAVQGIRHAPLDDDVRIFYTISGRDPTVFKLYAVARHEESGTGRPPKPRVQSDFASRLSTTHRRDEFAESRRKKPQ